MQLFYLLLLPALALTQSNELDPIFRILFDSFLYGDVLIRGHMLVANPNHTLHDEFPKMKKCYKEHPKIAGIIEQLADTIGSYEEEKENIGELTHGAKRIYIELAKNQLFGIASEKAIPLQEKLQLFYMIFDEHPFFDVLAERTIEVAQEYDGLIKYMDSTSKKVRDAFLIILRMTMEIEDRKASKHFLKKRIQLNKLITSMNPKENEELLRVGMVLLSRASLTRREKAHVFQALEEGIRSALNL